MDKTQRKLTVDVFMHLLVKLKTGHSNPSGYTKLVDVFVFLSSCQVCFEIFRFLWLLSHLWMLSDGRRMISRHEVAAEWKKCIWGLVCCYAVEGLPVTIAMHFIKARKKDCECSNHKKWEILRRQTWTLYDGYLRCNIIWNCICTILMC